MNEHKENMLEAWLNSVDSTDKSELLMKLLKLAIENDIVIFDGDPDCDPVWKKDWVSIIE